VPFGKLKQEAMSMVERKYMVRRDILQDPRNMQKDDIIETLDHIHSRQVEFGPEDAFRFSHYKGKNNELGETRYPSATDITSKKQPAKPQKQAKRKGKRKAQTARVLAEVEHDADTQMPREDEPQKPTKRKGKRKAITARVPAEVEHDADTQMPMEDEPQKPTKRKVKRKAKIARVPAEVEHDADTQMPMEEDPARAAQMNTLPGITYDFGDEPGLWNTTWEVNETRMPINESEANDDNTPLPAIDPSLINLRYDRTRVQAGNDDLAEHPALTAGIQIPGTDNGRQVPILIIPSLPSGRSTMMSVKCLLQK
jgi:hypothetical protein